LVGQIPKCIEDALKYILLKIPGTLKKIVLSIM